MSKLHSEARLAYLDGKRNARLTKKLQLSTGIASSLFEAANQDPKSPWWNFIAGYNTIIGAPVPNIFRR